MQKSKLEEKMDRAYNRNRRAVVKKISKPVDYNGIIFPSAQAVARHLVMGNPASIYYHIKNGHIKGKPIKYHKEEVNNGQLKESSGN